MDRYLIRPYTGSGSGYVAEVVFYSDTGEQLAVVPVTARKAVRDGLDLVSAGTMELLSGPKADS